MPFCKHCREEFEEKEFEEFDDPVWKVVRIITALACFTFAASTPIVFRVLWYWSSAEFRGGASGAVCVLSGLGFATLAIVCGACALGLDESTLR